MKYLLAWGVRTLAAVKFHLQGKSIEDSPDLQVGCPVVEWGSSSPAGFTAVLRWPWQWKAGESDIPGSGVKVEIRAKLGNRTVSGMLFLN